MGAKFKTGEPVVQIMPEPQRGIVKRQSMDDNGEITVVFEVPHVENGETIMIETAFKESELQLDTDAK